MHALFHEFALTAGITHETQRFSLLSLPLLLLSSLYSFSSFSPCFLSFTSIQVVAVCVHGHWRGHVGSKDHSSKHLSFSTSTQEHTVTWSGSKVKYCCDNSVSYCIGACTGILLIGLYNSSGKQSQLNRGIKNLRFLSSLKLWNYWNFILHIEVVKQSLDYSLIVNPWR